MKISFSIRPAKKNSARIQLKISEGRNKQYSFSTGYALDRMKDWNSKTGKVRTVAGADHDVLNLQLDKLRTHLFSRAAQAQAEGVVRDKAFYVDAILEFRYTQGYRSRSKGLWTVADAFDSYIDKAIAGQLPRALSKDTLKTYSTASRKFKYLGRDKTPLADVTMGWYREAVGELESGRLHGKPASLNYIGKLIKRLKTVLRDAEDSGHKVHQAFKSTSFRAPSETINEIYLSEDEVSILTALDVSGLKRSMKLTRDLFVIGCRTGLRVSDLRRLNFEHIRPGKSSRMFEMEVKKTGQTITVPIHELVEDLIASYGGNLPPSQAEQIMNRNLKILGELAGFNEPHTIFMTVGGQRQKSIHPKYALIKSHTARRSFCTNAFLSGVPTLDIMAISGHGTEANFFKYVKVTRQQHAERIAEHPFFKKKIG